MPIQGLKPCRRDVDTNCHSRPGPDSVQGVGTWVSDGVAITRQ